MDAFLTKPTAPPPPHLVLSPTKVGLTRGIEGVEVGVHAGVVTVMAFDGTGGDMAGMAGMGHAIGLDAEAVTRGQCAGLATEVVTGALAGLCVAWRLGAYAWTPKPD